MNGRGQSLKASRFTDNHDAMATMPANINGNARFATSIDVNFKRQIDALK